MNLALIFAGGTGTRMNSKTKPKQFLELNGKPIIIHTIELFESHPEIDAIAVVCLESWIGYLNELLERFRIKKVKYVVPGGETGQQSIRNGLTAFWDDQDIPRDSLVLIHDGVRPLINEDIITRSIECAKQYGNAITGTPAIETIITVSEDDSVDQIMDRSKCRMARAPQTFRLCDIVEAHNKAITDGALNMIDSAMLMSHYGATLHVVEGPVENIKISMCSGLFPRQGKIRRSGGYKALCGQKIRYSGRTSTGSLPMTIFRGTTCGTARCSSPARPD